MSVVHVYVYSIAVYVTMVTMLLGWMASLNKVIIGISPSSVTVVTNSTSWEYRLARLLLPNDPNSTPYSNEIPQLTTYISSMH